MKKKTLSHMWGVVNCREGGGGRGRPVGNSVNKSAKIGIVSSNDTSGRRCSIPCSLDTI